MIVLQPKYLCGVMLLYKLSGIVLYPRLSSDLIILYHKRFVLFMVILSDEEHFINSDMHLNVSDSFVDL